ncbi:MAG: alpha/beta hydrolase [Paraglaciecola sp.]|uniref:alpha/beta hydrolase n=1 Tax=Paraglaciecola sp. TaxID=1920173 RepID=UPI00273D51F8|nr:alpha/beta fold hydrolase [Paraglaciecola sp.]MDP5029880.1 alpha/beta hydrolase [Paraglaciecola sp.]MDP5131779.1 alpha/beta hydrolase [Paraglaciecola sp.]
MSFSKSDTCFVISCILAMMTMVVSLDATSAEQQVTLKNGLLAIHNDGVVTGQNTKVKGAVLLIHGWASQMNEVGDMFQHLAAELADHGYASLRINIRGESERELTQYTLTSTFASRIDDAQTGLNYLRQTYPQEQIGVVGFSLGGSTALALVGKNPQAIKSVVLWSSAGDPADLMTEMSPALIQQVLTEGEGKMQSWVELTITRQHLLGLLGYDVFTPLKNYYGALLSIRGSDDFVKPQENSIFAATHAQPQEFYLLSGADHIFHVLDPQKNYAKRVIAHTLHWFTQTL